MSRFTYPSISFSDPDAASAQLLQRIRELKELLHGSQETRQEIAPVATSSRHDSRSPSPKDRQLCGPETYEPPKAKESIRQICGPETFVRPKSRSFSPPTRESPVDDERKNSQNEAKLIEETWQLLANVTYVRVIIEKIIWDKCPKFVLEEEKHQKSPREKGQISFHYQIPSLTRLTPRGSGKTIKSVAREISAKAINFNHRHVSLCRINPAIVQFWAQTNLEIKFFYRAPNKTTSLCFAKCSVPMCKVLVLPFSFDSTVQLELSQEFAHCKGKLKVCLQLGSRIQYFLERVEPMRNPTTAVSPITFLNPLTINSFVERIPHDIEDNRHHVTVEKHVAPRFNDIETNFRDYEIENRGETRFVSPLRGLASARSPEESLPSTWRRLYPIVTTQDSLLHNGTWKDEGKNGPYRNETFLVPDDQPPHPMPIAATSSPLPEVDALSFLRHDIAFRSHSPPPNKQHSATPSVDATAQTNAKIMVDKHTESERFSPKKTETSTQTSKSRKKTTASNHFASDSLHSSGSTLLNSSQASSNHSRKKSITVAERLKTNCAQIAALPPINLEHQEWMDRSSNCPFVDLTSRSFLADKLKNNMDELGDLLGNIKRMLEHDSTDERDKMQSAATSTWPASPTSARTVTLDHQ